MFLNNNNNKTNIFILDVHLAADVIIVCPVPYDLGLRALVITIKNESHKNYRTKYKHQIYTMYVKSF